jgi:PAS domain S-box-containing protein
MSKAEDVVEQLIGRMESLTLRTRAVDEVPFGITIADVRQEDDPLVYANEGFTEITGYPESEILGRNCRFLQGPETADEPVAAMRRAIANEESIQVELRNYRKDGEQFWNQVTLAPLQTETGEVTHYVGFQQDVSTQKAYELELESQRDDLRMLNEMVRHDIRNDLQVAMAAMEVLEAKNGDDESTQEQITTALESIDQAIDLINTARDVADVMLDTGRDYRPINLGTVLEDQIHQCRDSFPEATITVTGTIPQVDVRANDLLESVFRNLLTNAITHNDTDTPEVLVTATTDGDTVSVTVADNGPGIPEDEREHIFERGWKGSNSPGTGIGLFIVDRLLKNYGGSIDVRESVPADGEPRLNELGGATFVVELPLAE